MHFCAQPIRACKHDAYAQRIAGVPFSQFCDDLGKVLLINRVPRDGNHDLLPKIGSMRIHDMGLERLSALRIDKSRRASARFETELIPHTNIAQHGYEMIHHLKIELTRFLLDLIPGDVKTDAS